jgi:hypothetical protein
VREGKGSLKRARSVGREGVRKGLGRNGRRNRQWEGARDEESVAENAGKGRKRRLQRFDNVNGATVDVLLRPQHCCTAGRGRKPPAKRRSQVEASKRESRSRRHSRNEGSRLAAGRRGTRRNLGDHRQRGLREPGRSPKGTKQQQQEERERRKSKTEGTASKLACTASHSPLSAHPCSCSNHLDPFKYTLSTASCSTSPPSRLPSSSNFDHRLRSIPPSFAASLRLAQMQSNSAFDQASE